MNLTAEQTNKVAQWLAEGAKLSEIQDRVEQECGLRLTYLETRLLVDDLRLTPKDQERSAPPVLSAAASQAPTGGATPQPAEPEPVPAEEGLGGVTVAVDTVARPGALISGKVSFSDGQQAEWYLDQMGRLGLMPRQQGYRPSAADMQAFQVQLERELQQFGI